MNGENKKTILLVEDEVIVAKYEKKQLEDKGYIVYHVSSGEKAVKFIFENKQHIDLILMDIDLGPGIDGTQAAERILKQKNIPLMFLSSHIEPEIVEKTENITSYGYAVKNSGITVIEASIKIALKLFEANRTVREIFDQSPIAIEFYNSDGGLMNVNKACIDLFGVVDEHEIAGFKLFEDPNISGDIKTKLLNKENVRFESEFNFEEVKRLKLYNTTCSGFKNLYCCITPLTENNRVVGYIDQIQDISERKQAESLLTQTRNNYETFFNTIDDFLFVLDEQGNIIHINATVIDRLGYTVEELTGKSVLMLHPHDRREEADRIVGEMLNGTSEFCPVPVITKSGVQIPVETRVSNGVWDGKPAIFGVTRDISRVQLSEEKFSKLFHINPSACGLTDLDDHTYIEVNEVFYSLLGFEKGEVIGKTASELGILTPETINAVMLKADNNGNVTNVEADLNAKNGDIRHVLLSSENISVQDKRYRFTVVNDVTDRKMMELLLRKSEEKHRLLIENSHDIIYTLTPDGIFTFVSPAWTVLLGHSISQVIDKSFQIFVDPEDIPACMVWLQKVIETGERQEGIEYRVQHVNGTWLWHTSSAVPLKDENGLIIGFEGTARDITERKIAEDKIKSLLSEKELILKEVHHRIKNNMNSIISLLSLHAETLKEPTAIMALADAGYRVQSMMLLYDKLYQSADIQVLSIKEYLPSLLNEIVANFSNSSLVKIEIKIDDFILGAKKLQPLGIIITELLTNIMKYAFSGRDSGLITVSASKTNRHAAVIIEDNGIGIPESVTFKNSTGFGLMLVEMLTEQINGTIRIERVNGSRIILEFDI